MLSKYLEKQVKYELQIAYSKMSCLSHSLVSGLAVQRMKPKHKAVLHMTVRIGRKSAPEMDCSV